VIKTGFMQGREDAQRGYSDVEALAGELLAPGSVFAFLAGHRGRLFPDSMMEPLSVGAWPAFSSGAGHRFGAGVAGIAGAL
jgi:hypothetical protein